MQIPFQVSCSNETIYGIVHSPKKIHPKMPVLIMCYGFNGNRTEEHRLSVKLGEQCEQNGICLVRFDYRGQGLSSGSTENITLETKIQDVLEVVSFMRGCFKDSDIPIYIIGFSDGARIVPYVLGRDRTLGGMILWNPIFDTRPDESLYIQNNKRNKLIRHPESNNLVFARYGMWINLDYLRELTYDSSYDDFIKVKCSKFCIFGEDDRYTKQIRESLFDSKPEGIHLEVIKEAGHLFRTRTSSAEVIEKTMSWIIDDIDRR